jgi:hypothetical protein
VGDEQETPPENELPPAVTVTGWLYQPFESAGRDSPAETAGLDASYENATLVAFADLPAASVQLPVTVALVESGPEYVVGEHETPPEKEVPLTVAGSAWLYQPFESAERDRPTVTVGLDASY